MGALGLDVIAPDGRTAALFALDMDSSTLVIVLVTEEKVWTSVAGGVTLREADGVWEVTGSPSATVSRRGPAGAVEGVELVAAGMGAVTEGGRRGALGLEMSMSRVIVSRPEEWLGDVRADARTPDGSLLVEGIGLWTERKGPEPARSMSLRGQHLAAGCADGTGWLWRAGSSEAVVALKVDPPGDDRALALVLADQDEVEGRVAVIRRWGIDRTRHPSSVAALVVGVVGGAAVAGITVDPVDPA